MIIIFGFPRDEVRGEASVILALTGRIIRLNKWRQLVLIVETIETYALGLTGILIKDKTQILHLLT